MNILLLRHYPLKEGPSMRSFSDQIASGMRRRGHSVEEVAPPIFFAKVVRHKNLSKWLGYVDMFILFPPLLWWRVFVMKAGSICVVTDQSLGPWIPILKNRPHIVHVHDLLALEAALCQQPFHRLSISGNIYQRWIRLGFSQACCFLSDSLSTRTALNRYLLTPPLISEMLLLPVQPRFRPIPESEALDLASQINPRLAHEPFLFHIGKNWYKNRIGLLQIWEQLHFSSQKIHLVLVGGLDQGLCNWVQNRPLLQPYLHILDNASDHLVLALYNSAAALLFPSHAEGFGWPILEALACGCPVVTTARPPMTEVGGDAVRYIPPYPDEPKYQLEWAIQSSKQVFDVLNQGVGMRELMRSRGLVWAKKFEFDKWLEQLESFYSDALSRQL